jgi:hypothetical protein
VQDINQVVRNHKGAGLPTWPTHLRVKRVQGAAGIFEMTWSFAGPDGRATFEVLTEKGVSVMVWRRIGGYAIFRKPAGIRQIQERIATAVAARRSNRNPLLTTVPRGTKVYNVVETLGAATELADLDALAEVPEGADALQSRLQEEVSALRGNSLDALVASAKTELAECTRLGDIATAMGSFSVTAYNESVSQLAAAQTEWRRYRAELFAPDELPGPADDDWQAFVVAGETYREHLGLAEYPQSDDLCLYCRQGLHDQALSLVQRYKTFLDETVVSRLRDAEDRVVRTRLVVTDADLTAADQFVGELATQETAPPWTTEAQWLLAEVRGMLAACMSSAVCVPFDGARAATVAGEISQARGRAEITHLTLVEQRDNRVQALADKQSQLNELTGRIELRRQLDDVKNLVKKAKEAARLDQLSRSMSSKTLRQLTDQSNIASKDLVNRSFERLFEEECQALRAPRVLLHFQGRGGKAERRKAVAQYKPSAVLSEGEQKVLALADFLAESRMRGNSAPVVFDDPVTSLDYRRHREVALRILRLAATHQVIVFTHNIMFASELLAGRNNRKLRCKFYEVRDDGVAKGILAPDVEPRLDTPKDIGKRINVKLETASHADPAVQDALISETYDLVRSWCEAFVEQEMLGNVTQRYRANVMMGELGKIKAGMLETTRTQVADLFDKACRCMSGHSQPAEYLNVKPTLGELKANWAAAQAMRKSYLDA